MKPYGPPLLALLTGLSSCSSSGNETATGSVEPFSVSDGIDRSTPRPDAPSAEWSEGISQAGWEFHRTLGGNAISSPLSIGTAFSLLRAGASSPTDTALDNIFGLPDREGAHEGANSTITQIEAANQGETKIEVSNQLFVRSEPLQPFIDTAAAHYGAPPAPLADDATQAASDINSWVDAKTRGLITEIVGPGDVTDSELVIVNTVYFFANWETEFDAAMTREQSFETDAGPVQAEFMNHPTPIRTRYVNLGQSVAVELPYADGDLSMWVVVPNEIDGLEAVEANLDGASLSALSDTASEGTIQFTMPKWEFSLPPTDLLDQWLCPQGLCAGAPTDLIRPGSSVSGALHAAKIIVDEKGTEAAAATAIMTNTMAPMIDLSVNADHPFLYAIVHEPTNALVFVGRVSDPTQS